MTHGEAYCYPAPSLRSNSSASVSRLFVMRSVSKLTKA
jgi:hypothetical protein